MKMKNTRFVPFEYLNFREYQCLIKRLLSNVDEVCFSVYPFLDSMEELFVSGWKLADRRMKIVYDTEVTDGMKGKTSMIIMKYDYHGLDYFLDCRDIFYIFENEDVGISIENPAFIKDGEVVMYTVSHEKICDIDENVWKKIIRNRED
ncbi:MAG: hypothetical protein J6A92_05080 [Lachnospiraceae bacterium]|nr:hypothetical protein [Lachnospiraceae bacterium]